MASEHVASATRDLHDAIRRKNEAEALKALKDGADPNLRLEFYESLKRNALHVAARRGCSLGLFQKILGKINNVNALDDHGETAMIISAHYGRTEIAKVLIARSDIDVNVHGNGGFTALMIAVETDRTDIVEMLIARPDIDVNVENPKYGHKTALHYAVLTRYENPVMVNLLLSNHPEINVNARDTQGKTALHYAAKKSNDEEQVSIVTTLIDNKNIDLNIIDSEGKTACDYLMARWHRDGNKYTDDIIKLFKEKMRPIDFVLSKYKSMSSQTNPEDFLRRALRMRDEWSAKILLDNGADPNIPNRNGWNALHIASKRDCSRNLFDKILDKIQNVNASNNDGNTALIIAVRNGRQKLVRWLLKRTDIQKNLVNNDGYSALTTAVYYNNLPIVRQLVDYYDKTPSSFIMVPTPFPRSPIRIAKRNWLKATDPSAERHGYTPDEYSENVAKIIYLLSSKEIRDNPGYVAYNISSFISSKELIDLMQMDSKQEETYDETFTSVEKRLKNYRNINAPDDNGSTLFMEVAHLRDQFNNADIFTDLIFVLCFNGANPNAYTQNGTSVLSSFLPAPGKTIILRALKQHRTFDVNITASIGDLVIGNTGRATDVRTANPLSDFTTEITTLQKRRTDNRDSLVYKQYMGSLDLRQNRALPGFTSPAVLHLIRLRCLNAIKNHDDLLGDIFRDRVTYDDYVEILAETPKDEDASEDTSEDTSWLNYITLPPPWGIKLVEICMRTKKYGHDLFDVDMREKDEIDRGALHIALRYDLDDITTVLLDGGVDPNEVDGDVRNALHYTVIRDRLPLFHKILGMIQNVNAVDKEGYTALIMAAIYNHLDMVVSLMNHPGTNVNVQSVNNRTALHYAVFNDYPAIVTQLLRDNRVDTSLKDNSNRTPLEDSIYYKRTECEEILREHERMKKKRKVDDESGGGNKLRSILPEVEELPFCKLKL